MRCSVWCSVFSWSKIAHTWLSIPFSLSDSLVCNEPSLPVISVSLNMSVITQSGNSPLMVAARSGGRTEVVSLLVEAEAKLDLQDEVNMWH